MKSSRPAIRSTLLLADIGCHDPGNRHRSDPHQPDGTTAVEVRVGDGYGATPEVAHDVLLICLTATEWPVVVAADGTTWWIPAGTLRALITRYA